MRRGATLAAAGMLALSVSLAAGPAPAQPTPRAAGEARRAAQAERSAAEAAARAAREAAAVEETLAEGRVETTRRVQGAETEAAAAAVRTRAAKAAAAAAEAEWRDRWAALAPAVPAMLRLGLWPAESLLASPASPEDAATGLLVLQGLSRRLAADAAALRAAAGAAREAAAVAEAEALALARAEAVARGAAAALDAELRDARRRRSAARDAEAETAGRAAEAAARATDLEGALARLEREAQASARREAQRAAVAAARNRPAPEAREQPPPAEGHDAMAAAAPPDPTRSARGGRIMPVAGEVSREFGTIGEGGRARGFTLQAPSGARVVSPCGGRVAFAAPFRSYGRLLIVDCGEGYHFVLGGLDRLDVSPGQKVLAGEPVGTLGGVPPGAGTVDGPGRATLYVELRRRGDPVDPKPWFAARG